MKVLTLSQQNVQSLSLQLLEKVEKDHFDIDVLIGIATGGIYVSRPIFHKLQSKGWQGSYIETKLSRTSTKTKKTIGIHRVLTLLPYALSDLLRIAEVKLFERFKSNNYNDQKEQSVDFTTQHLKQIHHAKTILLIDDAMDTGSTIQALQNAIHKINPAATIKSAVLTVTHKTPYLEPDYTLYKNVLLRCPWSMDYKGEDKIA